MINTAASDSNNDGEQDVTATILYDGSNYMLSLKSQFGAANEMKINIPWPRFEVYKLIN